MTLFDFIAQAGFWQWIGLIALVGVTCEGLASIIAAFMGRRP